MAQEKQVKVVRRRLNPEAPPRSAQWVGFSRVGSDIVMDVGFVKIHEFVEKLRMNEEKADDAKEVELDVWIYETFGLSTDAFLRLRDNVNEIFEKLKASGVTDTEQTSQETTQ